MVKSTIAWISIILVIIGSINLGLVGAFDIDVIASILGSISWLETTVYILIGLAGIWELIQLFKK